MCSWSPQISSTLVPHQCWSPPCGASHLPQAPTTLHNYRGLSPGVQPCTAPDGRAGPTAVPPPPRLQPAAQSVSDGRFPTVGQLCPQLLSGGNNAPSETGRAWSPAHGAAGTSAGPEGRHSKRGNELPPRVPAPDCPEQKHTSVLCDLTISPSLPCDRQPDIPNPFIPKPLQFSSVAQSYPTPCDPMNRGTPGLPVHH